MGASIPLLPTKRTVTRISTIVPTINPIFPFPAKPFLRFSCLDSWIFSAKTRFSCCVNPPLLRGGLPEGVRRLRRAFHLGQTSRNNRRHPNNGSTNNNPKVRITVITPRTTFKISEITSTLLVSSKCHIMILVIPSLRLPERYPCRSSVTWIYPSVLK